MALVALIVASDFSVCKLFEPNINFFFQKGSPPWKEPGRDCAIKIFDSGGK
jgi:hypothetical protein